mmetsp:Transcript_46421/g.143579  ORF Transcript_46421/g.143579 Transcript_46421/m.143579 type:complete len:125 (+) Transcript_46421:80-454(+)
MTPAPSCGLEVVSGLTESSSRIAVRALFEAFGPVDACWVLCKEGSVVGYLRFKFAVSAKAAATACERQEVSLAGNVVECRLWEAPAEARAPERGKLKAPGKAAPHDVVVDRHRRRRSRSRPARH